MWTTCLITNYQVHFVIGKIVTKHHCYLKGTKTKVKSSSLHPATFSAGQHLQWICVMNVQFIVFLTINYKFYNDFFSLNLRIWIYRLIISVIKWRFQWRCRSCLIWNWFSSLDPYFSSVFGKKHNHHGSAYKGQFPFSLFLWLVRLWHQFNFSLSFNFDIVRKFAWPLAGTGLILKLLSDPYFSKMLQYWPL